MFIFNFSVEYKIRTHLGKFFRGGFCIEVTVTIMLRIKNDTSKIQNVFQLFFCTKKESQKLKSKN